MPDWQERITTETEPALRVEHELRYRMAAPAVARAATWCDLGCGNGVAAQDAFGDKLPGKVVLVDREQGVVDTALDTLRASGGEGIAADLTAPADLERVRRAIAAGARDRVITCFEVVEHLETFVPLVEMLTDLAAGGEATVVLSVPNDAFWSIESPHHKTMWSEGAFEELRRLLPGDHVLAHQTSVQGSAIVVEPPAEAAYDVPVRVPAQGVVPTHFLVGFGPLSTDLAGGAAVAPVDLDAQRRWVRQRESDLSYMGEFNEIATREREEWRRYIHELEDQLGKPRSGTSG